MAALSSQNTLPDPDLDLEVLETSTSTLSLYPNVQQKQSTAGGPSLSTFTSHDPWNISSRAHPGGTVFDPVLGMGAPSSLSGSGLPKDWWRKQETVRVSILGLQGFILNRYTVYEVASDVSFCCLTRSTIILTDHDTKERGASPEKILRICLSMGLPCSALSLPFTSCIAT